MADDEEKQRRLEAKREYNRVLSAQKRQRNREEISSFASEAEFQADRANQAEQKNTELLQKVQALTAEHQRLSERVQQLTASSGRSSSTSTGGIGLAAGFTTTQSPSIGGVGGRQPDLATMASSLSVPPPQSIDDQRYNQQLAGLLSSTARSNSGGGGGGGGFDPILNSRFASSLTPRHHSLDQASPPFINQNDTTNLFLQAQQRPLNAQELDLLICLHSAPRNSANTFPQHSDSVLMSGAPPGRGIYDTAAALAIPVASAVAMADTSLLARLFATGQAGSPSSNIEPFAISVSADTMQGAAAQQAQLRHQQLGSQSAALPSGFPVVGLQQQQRQEVDLGIRIGGSEALIDGREQQQQQQNQLLILSLLERIKNQRGGGSAG